MKQFILKLFIFLIIIACGQTILTSASFPELNQINALLREQVHIIFLGDSTLVTCAADDQDRRTIPDMLHALLPTVSLGYISHGSYHLDIYAAFCAYIARQKHTPKSIIIPINMRAFSASWDRAPSCQFGSEKFILRNDPLIMMLYRPLLVFKYDFNAVSKKDFEHTPVYDGPHKIGGVKDFLYGNERPTRQKMINKLIMYYMYPLTKEHRMIQAITHIVTSTKKKDINVIFYITPIDVETGNKYISDRFSKRLAQNISVIKAAAQGAHIYFLDLSHDLQADSFSWADCFYPNEHLNQKGRAYVAQGLADLIKEKSIR